MSRRICLALCLLNVLAAVRSKLLGPQHIILISKKQIPPDHNKPFWSYELHRVSPLDASFANLGKLSFFQCACADILCCRPSISPPTSWTRSQVFQNYSHVFFCGWTPTRRNDRRGWGRYWYRHYVIETLLGTDFLAKAEIIPDFSNNGNKCFPLMVHVNGVELSPTVCEVPDQVLRTEEGSALDHKTKCGHFSTRRG